MVFTVSSRKYDPGCSSRIRILIFLPIPDPGVKKGTGSRIRIRNTGCVVVGPDPNWARGFEWWFRFQIRNLDLSPRKLKWQKKEKKGDLMFFRVGCSSWIVRDFSWKPGNPSRISWKNYVAFYSASGSWSGLGTAQIQIKIRGTAHNNGKEENVHTATGKE